jgi:hypothetical protein
MKTYRYILDKSSKKFPCPVCLKKTFVKYIETETGEYIAGNYGKCDREANCNTHILPPLETRCCFVPAESIQEHKNSVLILQEGLRYYFPKSLVFETLLNGCFIAEFILEGSPDFKGLKWHSTDFRYYDANSKTLTFQGQENSVIQGKQNKVIEPAFFPVSVFENTLKGYSQNSFIQNLLNTDKYPFSTEDVERVISLYYLGTVTKGYRQGAVTFPYIDKNKNVHAIQVKQFDSVNHTTGTDKLDKVILNGLNKENKPLPEWLTTYIKYGEQEGFYNCLFGEHLLNKYKQNPVALVEAPKTAVYGTLYFGFPEDPENFLWLAVYNLSGLNLKRCKNLYGRKVLLFPDLSKTGKAFEDWSIKAKQLQELVPNSIFSVSDLLERNATEEQRLKGFDLADFLIMQDWKQFRKQSKRPESNEYTGITNRIESIRNAIKEDQNRIEFLRNELPRMENTFIQAAKDLPIQWFDKSFTGKVQPTNRLSSIKYWCE